MEAGEVIIFPQNLKTHTFIPFSLESIIKCHKILTLDQTIVFKSKLLHKTKIYDHGLSPLLMQNPYSKFILFIKTSFFDRFSKLLQVLLRQIKIQILVRIFFLTSSSQRFSPKIHYLLNRLKIVHKKNNSTISYI